MNQVFVSYSSKDKDFALQLVSDLERFYDVWIDKGELQGGLEWEEMIDAAEEEAFKAQAAKGPDSQVHVDPDSGEEKSDSSKATKSDSSIFP